MTEYNWPLMKDTLTWKDRFKLAKFVLTADRFTQGEKVAEFEQAWADWLGVKYSVFVTSGSTANFLLLDAVREKFFRNKKSKLKVLVPACTWVTNVNPIIQLGMEPIFCDINLYDYSFDLSMASKIAKNHDIDIVFVTHLLGLPANIYQIKHLFPNAVLLEDVCESHGARDMMGHKVGSISLGSTFSFYYGHHMSTIEGGMVSTNNKELYDLLRMKRSHGMSRVSIDPHSYSEYYPDIDPQFLFVTAGYNFRNTELAAVLGLSQLPKLDGFIKKRQTNYSKFMDFMYKRGSRFVLPGNGYAEEGNSSFCFPLIAREHIIKEKLLVKLKECKIEYRPIVGGNLLKQPYLKSYNRATFKNADLLHGNGIYIGNNQFVGDKELELLKSIVEKV